MTKIIMSVELVSHLERGGGLQSYDGWKLLSLLGAASNQGWKRLKAVVVVVVVVLLLLIMMKTGTAKVERIGRAVEARDAIANDEPPA